MKSQKNIKRCSFLLALLMILTVLLLPVSATEHRPTLTVGGIPFGVRFLTDGILVVNYCDVKCMGQAKNPARDAGLRPGDCICSVNATAVHTAAELAEMIEKNGQRPLSLIYRRDGEEHTVSLCPIPCDEDGRLRTGLFVRDSGAGIGTVTFLKDDASFGGLGHGICDGDSGVLIPMSRGSVTGVTISEINKGTSGAPGELRGHFSAGKIGILTQNTPCGVFGTLTNCPAAIGSRLPIAYRNEVHDGAATLRCTLDNNGPREYTVEISSIHKNADGNKCFTVHVTDPDLLAKTGGIIQGMSGSPLVQDGRLIGAVTHVLIGDPTTGYGIFIENMLANMAEALG